MFSFISCFTVGFCVEIQLYQCQLHVGIDSITVSLNSEGIAVLEYMLYVLQDAGYSIAVIEESFEENLTGADENEFLSGNKVVNASFVLGE